MRGAILLDALFVALLSMVIAAILAIVSRQGKSALSRVVLERIGLCAWVYVGSF